MWRINKLAAVCDFVFLQAPAWLNVFWDKQQFGCNLFPPQPDACLQAFVMWSQ